MTPAPPELWPGQAFPTPMTEAAMRLQLPAGSAGLYLFAKPDPRGSAHVWHADRHECCRIGPPATAFIADALWRFPAKVECGRKDARRPARSQAEAYLVLFSQLVNNHHDGDPERSALVFDLLYKLFQTLPGNCVATPDMDG